ncbi:LysM peptidoglycan-binding domain-containing protein [Thiotrichales bacterium 19S3-7]|nr:LysM peptidoglycan-binding domain-containing protein [Thiotrichales bacterium 19S3-7]MCF6802341.1 LysM peptidoglycan-binding domain-containing protein [Thiotrichales bacterium 19S3-11]
MAIKHKFFSQLIIGIFVIFLPLSALAFTDYTVSKGDTLWGIAVKHKPSGVSTSDMIKAIKGLNISSSPAVVDNIVRLGDQLSLPQTKAEVNQAIAKLDQAQNNYQKVQKNGVVTDQSKTEIAAESTTNKPNEVVAVQSMQQKPVEASDHTTVNQPTMTSQSNDHAIISSVDQSQAQVTKTEQGYTLSVNQAATEKNAQKSESHFFSSLIWIIVAVIIVLLIVRRLRKHKSLKSEKHVPDYHRQTPGAGNLSDDYQPKLEIDASNISEVLVEAMLLLNDGRYDDARHTLQQTLKLKPDSIEIRMKLMEVYAASGDEISFNSERDYLAAHLMSHDDERWQEIDEIYHQYFIARG